MATNELTVRASAGIGQKLRLFLEASVAGIAALWRAAQNRRRVIRLLEWDNHMLRDIGLTAGDVHSALASPLGHDPSSRLSALVLERRRAIRAEAHERLDRQGYFLRSMLKQAPLPPLPDGRSDRLSA
jgi:uncharacterized protein YjiS (DUF1127 family)